VPRRDEQSLAGMVTARTLGTGDIEAPALLLYGDRDARTRDGAADQQAARFRSSESVHTRTFRGAGSALPLERRAPQVRREVLTFVGGLRLS
jgi:pimeloyl-ACP methyl ester carboxylesterase